MMRQVWLMILVAFIGACLVAWGGITFRGISSSADAVRLLELWVVTYYVLLFGQYVIARLRVTNVPVLQPPYPFAVPGSALLMWGLALVPFNILGHTWTQIRGVTPGTIAWEIGANLPSFFPLLPALWLAPRAIALDSATTDTQAERDLLDKSRPPSSRDPLR